MAGTGFAVPSIVGNRRTERSLTAFAWSLTFAVLLVSSNSSAATVGARDITDLSIEELAKIDVAPASRAEYRAVTVHPVATVRGDDMSPHFQSVSFSTSQEYNRPNPDPGIYASPSDMRYGVVPPAVAAAIRAFGPGS